MPRSALRNHPTPSWFKDYLTSVYILDNRQDNLGQVSSSQASQLEEAAYGRKSRPHTNAVHLFSRKFFLGGRGATGAPPGGSLTARQAAARHNNEITKGGACDE